MAHSPLCLEKCIRIIAGTLILVSLMLSEFVHRGWLFFTAFIGFNLLQSAFTDFCPAELLLRKIGIKKEKDLV